jgi:hypothetical protein
MNSRTLEIRRMDNSRIVFRFILVIFSFPVSMFSQQKVEQWDRFEISYKRSIKDSTSKEFWQTTRFVE